VILIRSSEVIFAFLLGRRLLFLMLSTAQHFLAYRPRTIKFGTIIGTEMF